jgi:hypothetical protein
LTPARLTAIDFGGPCTLQLKHPTYDTRAFIEMGSGFAVPQNRALPYVFTPRLLFLRPIDEAHRWTLAGSLAGRFGNDQESATIGARIHRAIGGSNPLLSGLTIGLGPDLVMAHNGGLDGVVEAIVDLTPLIIGARASWGPITLRSDAFSRPARLETFIGWKISTWRRDSTQLEELLHQPPPPRRRFEPGLQPSKKWSPDLNHAVKNIADTLAYLSLVQQLVIRFGAQFDHTSDDCERQLETLRGAQKALVSAWQGKPGSPADPRMPGNLEALLREQSQAFANAVTEGVAFENEAEDYDPDPLLLGAAVLHAIDCVLEGALSESCMKPRQ